MRPIGGYFELELSDLGTIYHDDAVALNTGRNALEHILRCKKYSHVHLPHYTCEVILEPFKRNHMDYSFYHIDLDFKPIVAAIQKNEVLLYTNYFGLMNHTIQSLSTAFPNLIIDNAQAFFDKPLNGTPTFYSPRKFFGLPDGGFAYHANEIPEEQYPIDISLDRISHLVTRIEKGPQEGYELFKSNDSSLDNLPTRRMSALTKKLMKNIDYESIKKRRLANFSFLHKHLGQKNNINQLIEDADFTCPLVYPYMTDNAQQLRKKLLEHKIYTAQYWPNMAQQLPAEATENTFFQNIIHLPIDQRYQTNDLLELIALLK